MVIVCVCMKCGGHYMCEGHLHAMHTHTHMAILATVL